MSHELPRPEPGSVERSFRERHDARSVDRGEHEMIDRVLRLMAEGRADTLGSGQSGDVIRLQIFEPREERWVLKRRNSGNGMQQKLGLTFADEFRLQDRALEIVERVRQVKPDNAYAVIPRPFSLVSNEEETWIIMEELPGETLFERSLRQMIFTYVSHPQEREHIAALRRDELLDMVMRDYGTVLDEDHFTRVLSEVNRYGKNFPPLLTEEQYTCLEKTIKELHRRGFHHRDLHPSNIMLLPDGRIGIIDFGVAVQTDPKNSETKSIYTVETRQIDERTRLQRGLTPDIARLQQYKTIAQKRT